jgi:Uma2 family endonuclease
MMMVSRSPSQTFGRALLPERRAEQIMGMPAERVRRRWTAREVRQLIADSPEYGPRYELIDGDLIVTPSPGFQHQMAVKEFLIAISLYCKAHRLGESMSSPSDVALEPESVRQPDVFVLSTAECKRLAREGFPAHELLLAVEVLSPSTAHVDRVRKRELYQRYVGEYWIVDTDARLVERWRHGDVSPEVLTENLTWHPAGASEPMVVDLRTLFARCWAED